MPTETQLSELVADLTDEELVRRLRNDGLTQLAAHVVQRELAARGISTEQLSAELAPSTSAHSRASTTARHVLSFVVTRVLRFPVRALQAAEPLWAVFVFGMLGLVAVYKLTTIGMHRLLFPLHVALNALMLSYALLGIYALTAVWLGIALWRTARRSRSSGLRLAARIVAVVIAANCVIGSITAARLIHDRFKPQPADGPSIMDSAPP